MTTRGNAFASRQTVAVVTSQQGWGQALASWLATRGVDAMALGPHGAPHAPADDTPAPALPARWDVALVDAADPDVAAACTAVDAAAVVALRASSGTAPPSAVDAVADLDPPHAFLATLRDPRRAAARGQPVNGHTPSGNGHPLHRLTHRERDVLSLLAEGASNAAVARKLGLSPHTVRTHVQNLYGKLNVGSRAEAVALLGRSAQVTR